jgi:hypothetical protein
VVAHTVGVTDEKLIAERRLHYGLVRGVGRWFRVFVSGSDMAGIHIRFG